MLEWRYGKSHRQELSKLIDRLNEYHRNVVVMKLFTYPL